jgi:cystathionine beta-lyase
MRRVDPLLGTCSLTGLRQRKSVKWQEYPPEVLPSFVAEMDFSLAEPIIAAITAALALGDCG